MADAVLGATRTVGTAALRVEDLRILTGRGRYVDDVQLPGMLHAAFLRSPVPHARIASLDTSAAEKADGVVALYTGRDFAARTSPVTPAAAPPGFRTEPFFGLAVDKVRFVGDPVVIVVARTRALAEDACELIEIDYDPLEAVADFEQALDPARPALFDSLGGNVVFDTERTFGDPDSAFAEAEVVVTETFSSHRVAQIPMECRGGVADYNPTTGDFTYYAGTQSPHGVRTVLSAALGLALERTRVLNGDIGGAFGLKIFTHREDLAVCAAAKWLGRPVKWMEDRNEHLLSSGQAREEKMTVEVAAKRDGTLLAMRGHLVLDQGAYPAIPFPGGGIVAIITNMMPGPYAWRGFGLRGQVVSTNKCTYNAYRGPWATETWVRERMINVVARELGLDPAAVRLRNFAPNDGSASMLTGPSLLGTSAAEALERALAVSEYEKLRAQQEEARSLGRCVGIGFACFIEAAPGPTDPQAKPFEQARVRLEPNGHLTVFTSQAPHGQGHETTLAQIAADEMGVAVEDVRVVHGDTSTAPFAMVGTGGSRAATMASGSVLHAARRVKEKVLQIAADMLEANPDDLSIVGGRIQPAGVPSVQLALSEVAARSYYAPGTLPAGVEAPLEATANYDGGLGGWSGGTHLCQVEIDLETGAVRIVRYLVVEDCGRMVNPAIVDGQIRGGVAQGIGEVLYEWSAYDGQANYLAGTFMDYLVPTASEIPRIDIVHLAHEPNEEVDYRGVGEGGMIVTPAALTNAIEDALSPFGARVTEQYLPPAKVLELAGRIAPSRA